MKIKGLRTCVVCRQRFAQKELLRFVLLGGRPVFDDKKRVFGRGYYVCRGCLGLLDKKIKKF